MYNTIKINHSTSDQPDHPLVTAHIPDKSTETGSPILESSQEIKEIKKSETDKNLEETKAPEETEETKAPEETEETKIPEETEETKAPEETEETKVPEKTEETKVPEKTEETKIPEETEETKIPEETEETKIPEETEETKIPEETEETIDPVLPPAPCLPEPASDHRNGISIFGFSQKGESHITSGKPCQDRSAARFLSDSCVIAAVADGVGSCALSDYGADTAVRTSLDYLEEQLTPYLKDPDFRPDAPLMGRVLREMMRHAYDQVERRAEEMEQMLFSFQSTLTVAVYTGATLFFAHAGDDGIVVVNDEGKYEMVTSRHKGEEASSVYPLQNTPTWQFGMVDHVIGFILATDGVLDAFVRSEAENNRIYYPFIEPAFSAPLSNKEATADACSDWYTYMQSPAYRSSVTDDLSFVCVVNQEAKKTAKSPEFDISEWNKASEDYEMRKKSALYPQKNNPSPEPSEVNSRKDPEISQDQSNQPCPQQESSAAAPAQKTPTQQGSPAAVPTRKTPTQQGSSAVAPARKTPTQQGSSAAAPARKTPTQQRSPAAIPAQKTPTQQRPRDSKLLEELNAHSRKALESIGETLGELLLVSGQVICEKGVTIFSSMRAERKSFPNPPKNPKSSDEKTNNNTGNNPHNS